ncbi:MAG: glucokinase [Burkholderiales bacterium]|nr:glucokinase [Burkholderiales bacterium]
MAHESFPRLLGDIGGTNARFAWQTDRSAAPTDVATYACAEHDSLLAAVRHYLAEHGKACPPVCAIGIANPVLGDRVQMTNHHWSFSIVELQQALGLKRLKVINDFTALALSLPGLQPADLRRVGPAGVAVPGAALAVLGPGTGLGVSGLLASGTGGFVPVTGEGGHVTLAAQSDHETAVIDVLARRFGHASAERALSGPGLVNLYAAACTLAGRAPQPLGPAEVIARASAESDPSCAEAIELFCNFLGGVAGNLALTLGARGGVYIGGGLAPRLHGQIERSAFRERFTAKGRFREYLETIPTFVIDAQVSPALMGAASALDMAD